MHDNIDSLLDDDEIAQCDISYYAIPGGKRDPLRNEWWDRDRLTTESESIHIERDSSLRFHRESHLDSGQIFDHCQDLQSCITH